MNYTPVNTGCVFSCSSINKLMTPSEFEVNARIVSGDPKWSLEDDSLKSFPPATDTIVWIKQVDWADVRQRCRGGLNNCGIVIAVTGEKMHELGTWLAQV